MTAERYPHGELERFRIHLRRGSDLRLIATCPDAESLGVALLTLFEDGEILPGTRVGILEAHNGPDKPGRWIVSPFVSGDLKTADDRDKVTPTTSQRP